jgi:hypothetical protein
MCWFSRKYAALRSKNRDWLARNQNNVSEWSDMSTRGLLFQWASTIKSNSEQSDIIMISLKVTCSRHDIAVKIAELGVKQQSLNHSWTRRYITWCSRYVSVITFIRYVSIITFIRYVSVITFIRYVSIITFIRYVSVITFIRYVSLISFIRYVSVITFIRYARSQNIITILSLPKHKAFHYPPYNILSQLYNYGIFVTALSYKKIPFWTISRLE